MFLAACATALLLPETLGALVPQDSASADSTAGALDNDRDLQKILRELPQAREHLPRLRAACARHAGIYPIPPVLAAKVLAIESGFADDAISSSFAAGAAQLMHTTARELGAALPEADVFADQDEVLRLRGAFQRKMSEAVAAFQEGDDAGARAQRAEAETLREDYDLLHATTMESFRRRMFALTPEARRAYDARFDPAVADDLVVRYLAMLARGVKRDLNLSDEAHVLLLAGVAYNAGPGSVKRATGIPVVAQNVEYANKLMAFQRLSL